MVRRKGDRKRSMKQKWRMDKSQKTENAINTDIIQSERERVDAFFFAVVGATIYRVTKDRVHYITVCKTQKRFRWDDRQRSIHFDWSHYRQPRSRHSLREWERVREIRHPIRFLIFHFRQRIRIDHRSEHSSPVGIVRLQRFQFECQFLKHGPSRSVVVQRAHLFQLPPNDDVNLLSRGSADQISNRLESGEPLR